MESDIYSAFDLLVSNPEIGFVRPDITAFPCRFWAVRKHYIIVYQQTECIEIIRVLSGYQVIAAHLSE
jgi:plasmid stabilization system protein ParE